MTLAGLEALFMANRDALLRFLRARGAGEDVEDLLQELWLRVQGAPAGPIAESLPYLMRAANNLMLDRARGRLRTMRREQDWADASGPAEIGTDDEADAERILIGRDELARAEQLLASLGSRVEAIFRRYRLDGIAIDQVAREFGLSRSSVEKDLQKAYRALLNFRSRDDA